MEKQHQLNRIDVSMCSILDFLLLIHQRLLDYCVPTKNAPIEAPESEFLRFALQLQASLNKKMIERTEKMRVLERSI